MYRITVTVDKKKYIKTVEGQRNLFELTSLLNMLGAHFEKAGIKFDFETEQIE